MSTQLKSYFHPTRCLQICLDSVKYFYLINIILLASYPVFFSFVLQDGTESVVKDVLPGDSVHSLLSILDTITVSSCFFSLGYVLICLLKCLCQCDLFIHYLHAPETKLMYFVFAVICLFKAASFQLCFSLLKIHHCHPFHTLRLMLFGTDCAVMNSNHVCNVQKNQLLQQNNFFISCYFVAIAQKPFKHYHTCVIEL